MWPTLGEGRGRAGPELHALRTGSKTNYRRANGANNSKVDRQENCRCKYRVHGSICRAGSLGRDLWPLPHVQFMPMIAERIATADATTARGMTTCVPRMVAAMTGSPGLHVTGKAGDKRRGQSQAHLYEHGLAAMLHRSLIVSERSPERKSLNAGRCGYRLP